MRTAKQAAKKTEKLANKLGMDAESAAKAADAARAAVELHQQVSSHPERFKRPKRGLIAQYNWLTKLGYLDDSLHELHGETTVSFSDIELWRHKVRGATSFSREKASRAPNTSEQWRKLRFRIGFPPPTSMRPNPCVAGDVVAASLFSPGRVVAVNRKSGERLWAKELDYYGAESFSFDGETLYGGTSGTLLALDPLTGIKRWQYEPNSNPTVFRDRVFIGDREGYVHCLDARSGKLIWWQRPSRARNSRINTTPRAFGDRFILATNSRLALAYRIEDGRELWRTKLDRQAGHEIQEYEGAALVRTVKSIYLLDPESGEVVNRWHWRNFDIQCAIAAGDILLLVRRRMLPDGRMWPQEELSAFKNGKLIYSWNYPSYSCTALRYDKNTGLLYESTQQGLGVLDPGTGNRTAVIRQFGTDTYGMRMPVNHVALPAVSDGNMYFLTKHGDICAGRHP